MSRGDAEKRQGPRQILEVGLSLLAVIASSIAAIGAFLTAIMKCSAGIWSAALRSFDVPFGVSTCRDRAARMPYLKTRFS